ncbi:MAG TPA: SH3 domain-containing protein [Stellaceae bacterium]|jgi:SH3-like domain-containing protein|nr:SH3 domain-containing protein [Stellaceae bacterium]
MAQEKVEQHRNRRLRAAGSGVLALCLVLASVLAVAADEESGLKVPRFVSLRSDKVNLRSGPGSQYPIDWVLVRRDMPVEIIAQFEHWRRVREWDGTVGWVQEHMVAGKRYIVVNSGGVHPIYRQPDPEASIVARAEPGVMARLAECRGAWCRIETDDVSGWMKRTDIWGVYPDEAVP